jgi:hypothetical protein
MPDVRRWTSRRPDWRIGFLYDDGRPVPLSVPGRCIERFDLAAPWSREAARRLLRPSVAAVGRYRVNKGLLSRSYGYA